MALASDGLIYSWGSNNDGQLGVSEEQDVRGVVVTSKDSNHSGIPDVWQIANFGHTGIDGAADADGDGLTNAQEYRLGTDPNKSDTDGDEVPDGADGWPLNGVVAPLPLPLFRYAIIDISKTRIWGANNSPDGVIDYPVDRNDQALFPIYIFHPNGDVASPAGYNDAGQIVADISTARGLVPHAGYYPDTPVFVLGDSDETYSAGSNAIGINNRGQILLNAHLDGPDQGGENLVLYGNGGTTVIPRRTAGRLNNDGDIISDNILFRDGQTTLPFMAVALTDRFSDGTEVIVGSSDYSFQDLLIWRDGRSTNVAPQGQGAVISSCNNQLQMLGKPSNSIGSGLTLWNNGKPFRVDQDLINAQPYEYSLFGEGKLNERGMFTCYGFRFGQWPRRAYLLMPVDLVVDGNRDGQMSLTDRSTHDDDITSAEKPYRFWTNDDDDTEQFSDEGGAPIDAKEVETVPALQADSSRHQIISKRNLEDFARLWL